jgi:tetratricopeptide (TPR) repeat protein
MVADLLNLETLLRQGVELSQAKRFQEAEPIFRQVLTLEPRHTGAAYLLALCLYFTGQFREALHLFGQLIEPGSSLEPVHTMKLKELAHYARLESLRLDYWERLKVKTAARIVSLHARILNRAGRIVLLSDFRDVDDTIGSNLEVVREAGYELIPFVDLYEIELGTMKRWITAQVVFREGRRETVQTSLAYRDSMSQSAWGVKEGVNTIIQPDENKPDLSRAYGHKQFRSVSSNLPISEILKIEF